MKLAFWTLGMPAWSNAQFAQHAAELGYDGVVFRCTKPTDGKPTDLGNLTVESTDAEIEATRHAFAAAGVELVSLVCYNHEAETGRWDSPGCDISWDVLESALVAYARLAQRLGSPRVRITVGEPRPDVGWGTYLTGLGQIAMSAIQEVPGTQIAFANHFGGASAAQLFALAEQVGDARFGVAFSPDHCVVMQEDAVALVQRYAPFIHQVSFADRNVDAAGVYQSCVIGEGYVPAGRIFESLQKGGFDGFVSLKWEKSDRFGLHLPEGEPVLSQFIQFMRSLGVVRPDQRVR